MYHLRTFSIYVMVIVTNVLNIFITPIAVINRKYVRQYIYNHIVNNKLYCKHMPILYTNGNRYHTGDAKPYLVKRKTNHVMFYILLYSFWIWYDDTDDLDIVSTSKIMNNTNMADIIKMTNEYVHVNASNTFATGLCLNLHNEPKIPLTYVYRNLLTSYNNNFYNIYGYTTDTRKTKNVNLWLVKLKWEECGVVNYKLCYKLNIYVFLKNTSLI